MVLKYLIRDLFKFKTRACLPATNIVTRLKELGIFHYRGKRGGRNTNKKIPTLNNRKPQPRKTADCKERLTPTNIIEVPRLWYSFPSLFLSNVTSLTNKLDELITTVQELNVDVTAITETWQVSPEIMHY